MPNLAIYLTPPDTIGRGFDAASLGAVLRSKREKDANFGIGFDPPAMAIFSSSQSQYCNLISMANEDAAEWPHRHGAPAS
jgi:hypothetical protein